MRIEYLRARARAERCGEQVLLLIEEKRRVLVTLAGDAVEWERRATVQNRQTAAGDGRAAYAAKQAAIQRKLAAKFTLVWSTNSLSIMSTTEHLPDGQEGAGHNEDAENEGENHGDDAPDLVLSSDEDDVSDGADSEGSESDSSLDSD